MASGFGAALVVDVDGHFLPLRSRVHRAGVWDSQVAAVRAYHWQASAG